LDQLQGPVIIAMIAVRMMQPAVHEIVNMIAMRDLLMAAAWTMYVRAVQFGRALCGISCAHRDDMFVDVTLVHMVEMAVMEIIDVPIMSDCGVPAIRAMLVSVVGVVPFCTWGHGGCSFPTFGCLSTPAIT
jgi:hypothetical protein